MPASARTGPSSSSGPSTSRRYVCPGGVATEFALEEGRGRKPEALAGMMSAEDVAEVVMFVLTRPRNHRILETALRPTSEPSWG
jgi:3-oxoacyl-[acyl-carrier protein] reductase